MAAPTRRGVRWEEPCCRRWGLLAGSGLLRAGEPVRTGTAQGRTEQASRLALAPPIPGEALLLVPHPAQLGASAVPQTGRGTQAPRCERDLRNLCNHGAYFLAANSSLCGLAANNFFRNILHVRKASLVSALPMAVIPFLSTAVVYEVFVRQPLFSGELNCEVCAVVRGGLIGAVVGGFYPIFLALPVNASLAARYSSSPLPGKENLIRFWLTTAQPVFRKMSLGILVQLLTGLYLATKHHGIYLKVLQRMNTRGDPEELQD
ncbi:transmembrane protein 126A-like isoform X1 [Chroicocephalus ridibundus]|uniref:transmembrane protein 126A-like isoform X1 n=1 Tax=Chroicocephalus ridibundus TaxID=1192867 RepID=UPI002FDC832B